LAESAEVDADMMHLRFAVAVAIASLAAGPVRSIAAQPDPAIHAARVDQVFAAWNGPDSPGCAVAVMKDGRIVYERGYGLADLNHDVKITPATVFDVGSMAKQFTAAAILMLAHEDRLSLDDPIRQYIPELPNFGAPITLREMLHHTSGLRDYEQLLRFDGWRLDSPDLLTDGDILYILSKQKELNFPPGSDFLYSNTNYELLARVVSRVSGQSFPDFTTARLFHPLGMSHTHFRVDHGEVVKNLAYAYERKNGRFDLSIPNYDTVGATNLLTTVEDLARWDENFYSARVGGAEVIRQLQEPGRLNDGTQLVYAEGLFVGAPGGFKIVETGDAGDAGYSANLSRFPDHHLSVATLCNNRPIDSNDLSNRVADIYLDGKLSAALAAAAGVPGSFQPDPKQLAARAGIYVDRDENFALRLEQRGQSLWAESLTGPSALGPAQLESLGPNRFRGLGMKELQFADDPNRHELTVTRWGVPPLHCSRVPEYKPTIAELREFAGLYSTPELDVPYYLTLEGGSLVLHPPKRAAAPLKPIAADLFIGSNRRVRFTRDAQGHVSGLLMSGPWNRVENLRFQRVLPP
jgi:CubicO group peptidase (beta-lactamase class C family)